jgi:hypothetical protein
MNQKFTLKLGDLFVFKIKIIVFVSLLILQQFI